MPLVPVGYHEQLWLAALEEMHLLTAKRLRIIPMLLVMGTIFSLSNQPGDTLDLPSIIHIDKLAHLLVYGLLAGTVIYAFQPGYRIKSPKFVCFFTIIICFVFGVSDEFHQTFIPYRSASINDIVADTLGAVIVSGIWLRLCFQEVKPPSICKL